MALYSNTSLKKEATPKKTRQGNGAHSKYAASIHLSGDVKISSPMIRILKTLVYIKTYVCTV